jgi:Domain amino terminal to FKBP-type peptidyl-prolyl isomerase
MNKPLLQTTSSTLRYSHLILASITIIMIRSVLFFLISALLVNLSLAGTNAEGLAFLAAKETEEGVVKLPSGLL